jgi:nucleoside-diphosphate-sugar epimerase
MSSESPDGVVVFGASGFIGRNLVEMLRGRVEMLGGVNATGRPVEGCDWTVGAAAVMECPALPSRTIFVNVAASRYLASTFAHDQAAILSANLGITNQVYRLALARKITEVRVASSVAVYPAESAELDDARRIDLNAWPHAGEAAYAWSKRWGEIAADLWRERKGVSTISLRLTNPYGAFDSLDENEAHVATAFVIRSLVGEGDFAIRGDPDAERDFVFAGDVAAAFVASLSSTGVHAALNCAQGRTTKIADLAREAMRAARRVRPLSIGAPVSGAAGVKVRRATSERLRQVIPTVPPFRSLADGVATTMAWYRNALR